MQAPVKPSFYKLPWRLFTARDKYLRAKLLLGTGIAGHACPYRMLEKYGRQWDSGLEKQLNAMAELAIPVEAWKTAVLRAMWTLEAQCKRYLRGIILVTGKEVIPVIFSQRT